MTEGQKHLGKVVLVTGAASGIGRASAAKFVREGASVALSDINEAGGQEATSELRDLGGQVVFVNVDVTDEASVQNLVNTVVDRFGRLDFAHNNAGGLVGAAAPTTMVSFETWRATIALNLDSAFLLTKYEILAMLGNPGGSIVITSSGDGLYASPTRQAYAAAKAGVINFVRAVAGEYGDQGIRINAVAPGPIRTPLLEAWLNEPGFEEARKAQVRRGIPRLGEGSEIADAVSYLCSEEATYVNGTVLPVDGGMMGG